MARTKQTASKNVSVNGPYPQASFPIAGSRLHQKTPPQKTLPPDESDTTSSESYTSSEAGTTHRVRSAHVNQTRQNTKARRKSVVKNLGDIDQVQ